MNTVECMDLEEQNSVSDEGKKPGLPLQDGLSEKAFAGLLGLYRSRVYEVFYALEQGRKQHTDSL